MKRLLRLSRNSNQVFSAVGASLLATQDGRGREQTRSRRRPRSALITSALLSFFAATSALAALVPTEWEHRQSLNVPAAGLVKIEPTTESLDAAGSRQEDLRIINADGQEIAYSIGVSPVQGFASVQPKSFEVKLESGITRITIDTGTTRGLASVNLETPHPFFLRAATIEVSDDNTHWTLVDQGTPLFRQWGAERLELPLGGRTAAYVRISVSDLHAAPVPFTGALLNLEAGRPPTTVSVGAHISRREEFAGETVLTIALDGRHQPLCELQFDTSDLLFMRHVTVAVREVNGAISSERTIGHGTIFRVALDGAPARAQLSIPLSSLIPMPRELLVHIQNGDSPPLNVETAQAKRIYMTLAFMAPAAGTYTLLSGNPQATAPRYDLAAFAGEMHTASATTVVPGALEATPNYQPRASLGTAPLPDVPLAGAPLDTTNWTQHRALELTRAGVQELELDPAALAKAQADFGDLRVLHTGNQIPYILEQSSLARALTLAPLASPDPKRPSVSLWQLALPHAGLPLRRLVLTSSTPLFQRQFRVYEKVTNQNGASYEITLASGTWSRTPEPGVPETKIVELSDRSRTGTLWLETDNGDNPAIALGTVQAIYPVVRLIFKTADTDGFALAYGNPQVNAPRYDLSLVAVKLLTSPRNAARLSASAPDTGSGKNLFAGINGGFIFWGALALVVVVLLVVVAKLLPKPPAG